MKALIYIFITLCINLGYSQNSNLTINYIAHSPFVIKDSIGLKGIEIDILNEYLTWLKTTKKKDVTITYNLLPNYAALIAETKKKGNNSIGIGACISAFEKTSELEYSTPYLKNLSFCITNGNAPDIKNKTRPEIYKILGNMSALTMSNTNLSACINEVKKLYVTDLKINYLSNESEILNTISKNVLNFGYVDAIDFWLYLKNNPNKFLKIQKTLDQTKETFSFVLPKGSEHKKLFDEFFLTFKTGIKYRVILEKYLGGFMSQNMVIK